MPNHTGAPVGRFRSTPPREGRLLINDRRHVGWTVSIHAPTRGATTRPRRIDLDVGVSIHAPTRGATLPHRFPSTSAMVSIHAPTRGATRRRSASIAPGSAHDWSRDQGPKPHIRFLVRTGSSWRLVEDALAAFLALFVLWLVHLDLGLLRDLVFGHEGDAHAPPGKKSQ